MKQDVLIKASLLLEDGAVFSGISFGAKGIAEGEVVFNTATTGYQEMLTDCSYAGQILTLTYPHIGNVGINLDDFESEKIWLQGLVVKHYSHFYSNWRAKQSLGAFLKAQNILAIANIDTRALTHRLRNKGSMKGWIATEESLPLAKERFQALNHSKREGKDSSNDTSNQKDYTERDYTDSVTLKKSKQWSLGSADAPHIVVYDFGLKYSIARCLERFNCRITVVPASTSVEEINTLKPDGIVLSNGPGDPRVCTRTIMLIQQLIKTDYPIFGICLGHQLLGLALGAKVEKMKFGHHGANHPVQNLKTGQVMITSQNHGYTVSEMSLPQELELTHRSLFDGTLQGFRHKDKPIFSFQGHPEAGPGPFDARFLFNDFRKAVETVVGSR